MATASGSNRKTPRGNVHFELEGDGNAITVHLDRQGFRRLLETLERLAGTGEAQMFEKSGRGRAKFVRGAGGQSLDLQKLMFRIDEK